LILLNDAMGREVRLARPAHRVVSLVPSETETVVMLGALDRLVGRTDYCVEPRGIVEGVSTMGGTKDARIADVIACAPDLVLVNQEENTPQIVRALEAASITTHVSFPKTVEDAALLVREIATMLGIDLTCDAITTMDAQLEEARARRATRTPVRVFCPIWMDPLMTIHGETFLSDALDLAGGVNVFADRPRRYPLAADLGTRAALPSSVITGRDTRYPRVTLEEVAARAPALIVLPDEPHPFDANDARVFSAIEGARVIFVSGRDLSWYSPRMGQGVLAIAEALDAHRG